MNAFKTARLEAGLSTQAVAEIVGVSASAVNAWERGKTGPTAKRIPKLAKALKKSPSAIINMFNE
jgi:transcriptional regulator with XRE-family HTH domain